MTSISRFITALFILGSVCRGQDPADQNRPRLLRPGLAQQQIRTISFLPDSRTLVTNDGINVSMWDAESGLLLRTLVDGAGAAVTPNGKFLWREHLYPIARNVRWDLNDMDAQKSGVDLVRSDLLFSDGLDAMLAYRQRDNGDPFVTAAPLTPGYSKAEWAPLPPGKGHQEAVRFNPAGQTVAIGYYDGRLLIYDYVNKKTVFETTEPLVLTRLAYSPDGKLLATVAQSPACVTNLGVGGYSLLGTSNTCSGKSTVRIREADTGKLKYSFGVDAAHSLAFSADGHILAVGNAVDIRLLDVTTFRVTRVLSLTADHASLEPTQAMSVHVAFSPDGKWLAETSHGPIYIFDMATGHVVRSLAEPPLGYISSSVLTRDNRLLMAVMRPDHVAVTELTPGISRRILKMRPANWAPVFSSDGSTFAAATMDRKLNVWNVNRSELLCTVNAAGLNGDLWRKFDLSGDGSLLMLPSPVPEGPKQGMEIWDTRSCRVDETIAPPPPPAPDVKFAAATRAAVAGARDGLRTTVRVAISPTGRFAAWVNRDNVLSIWDRGAHRLTAAVRVPIPAIYSTTGPQGKIVNRVQGEDGQIPLGSLPVLSDRLLTLEQVQGGILGINFSPDESAVATLDYNGQARLWSTWDGRLTRVLGSIAPQNTYIFNGAQRYTFGYGSMAFSADGRFAVNTYIDRSRPTIWDLSTGAALRPLQGFTLWCASAAFSSDGKTVMALGRGTNQLVMDAATGNPLATISLFGDGQEWLVHTPDGLFDGSPAAYRQLGWAFPDKSQPAVPSEAFFADYFRPGLLPDVLGGKRITASREVGNIDRRQAKVEIEVGSGLAGAVVNTPATLLYIRVTPPPGNGNSPPPEIHDLRLFRNGSLVRIWPGALKVTAAGRVSVPVSVPIGAGVNQFVAYAFNEDNVQTAKGLLVLDGALSLSRKGIAYIVVAGINRYENPEFNLRYAVADANLLAERLAEHLKATRRYSDVRIIALLDADMTKRNLETTLVLLGGGASGPTSPKGLAKARPEDAVFLFFAGHGWAQGGRFYLIPHDLGYRGSRARLAADQAGQKTILEHAISDRDIAGLVKDIDAGLMAMIIDACNSGQMLESDEARQGPFNSKGLAQLAWDKGMYVLTAAQSYQAAMEDSRLQHGFLTYALVEEGLNQRKADRDPEDGQIDIREWLDYAAARVPEMQRESQAQTRLMVQRTAAADLQTPRVFYRSEIGRYALVSGLKAAQVADCANEQSAKSIGGPSSRLTFENLTASSTRKLYYIDLAGNRQFLTTIAAGASYTAASNVGGKWVVTDLSESCVAIFTSGTSAESAAIQK